MCLPAFPRTGCHHFTQPLVPHAHAFPLARPSVEAPSAMEWPFREQRTFPSEPFPSLGKVS